MAPSLTQPSTQQAFVYNNVSDYKDGGAVAGGPSRFNADAELKGLNGHHAALYPKYLPHWDFEKKFPELEDFEYIERGKGVDESYPELLKNAQTVGISGNIGQEVRGVQLSQLNEQGRNELAHYVAKNRVVAFRDQDFADLPISEAKEFVKYFGRLHIHPTSPAPAGHPEVHVVHRGAGDTKDTSYYDDKLNSIAWHTDVSYERQPPGVTFLYMLDGPSAGGDTIFCNMVEAYNRLSPEFRKRLHGLKAHHTGSEQAIMAAGRGGVVRREPVTSEHPLIRTHPATGEKALYVNPQFTRRIIGLKKDESDLLLKFLFNHIALGQDFQARLKWSPGTVVVWDNRVTTHTAILDWHNGDRRHIARITPQAEHPYETPFEDDK